MTFEQAWERISGMDGWLSLPEAKLLWTTARSTEGIILEVGCYKGRSTVLLASLTGIDGEPRQVYSVDPFTGFDSADPSGDKVERAWRDNLARFGIENVTLFRRRIEDWQPRGGMSWEELIGFAYLDGDHSYFGTCAQIERALATSARVLALHDVNDQGAGVFVEQAALELLGPWSERVERLAVWKMP